MKCTINGIELSFDRRGRLYKTITRVAKSDVNKSTALASFLLDDDFMKYVINNITTDDIIKGETVSINEFKQEDYAKINQNKLGSLLNVYYLEHYHSVSNSKTTKGSGKLNGFTSASAKTVAKRYTASLLIDEYSKELSKDPKIRRKPLEVIRDVNKLLLKTLYNRTEDFAKLILGDKSYSKEAKEYAKHYIDIINEIVEINNQNATDNSFVEQYRNIRKEEKEKILKLKKLLKKSGKENTVIIDAINKKIADSEKIIAEQTEEINKFVTAVNERIARRNILLTDRYIVAQNLINLYSNANDHALGERLTNFANLVAQTRGDTNAWYFQVFNTKTMTSIIKEFSNVGDIEEYLEAQDDNNDSLVNKYNDDGIDETAKSWEDSGYRNFNQSINGKLKVILSSIPKLAERYNPNDSIQAIDTNNELGVPTYMDAQYLTVQIYSFADSSNIESFIDSLDKKSQSIKALYGLGQLVDMMRKNRNFANFVFANFAKPVINKTMLTVSDIANQNGISFDYSNTNAFQLTEMVFRMTNKLRATYNNNYNINDSNELDKIFKEFNKNKDKTILCENMFKIISKYFPNFDKEVFNNYFDNISNEELQDSVHSLIANLQNIIDGVGKLKDQIHNDEISIKVENDKKRREYLEAVKAYTEMDFNERKLNKVMRPQKPSYKFIDYANYDLNKTIYSGIFEFAKQIVNYTESKVRLNSTNAEGNSSSDVGKNCYVTRFFETIKGENGEDTNAGLKTFKEYITQGDDDGKVNQYANNPLFFGIKDENGRTLAKGMFERTTTGINIGKNAKSFLNYSLFDGVKNVQDNAGNGYAKMSKMEFFLTQYMAFANSVTELNENGRTTKIGDLDSAVYSMRIGSDAPKIYFIRAPKYNSNQVKYAFYNHVLDEINMFCIGLSNLFIQDGTTIVNGKPVPMFKTRTDITNLIGRAFFDEKTANKIKQKGGTDFTEAIVKDGKLTGNLFKFNRLFETNGYNAGAEIERILSLYGESSENPLFIQDEDGRLILNTNETIAWDGKKFIINLSKEQKTQLLKVIVEWQRNYLEDAKSRTAGFTRILRENGVDYNDLILDNFFLNTANMNMNYDDMFEGDYKYYNGARDFLKRTKESQAGGDGYAGYDIFENINKGLHELTWNGAEDVIRVDTSKVDKNRHPVKNDIIVGGKRLVARNGWRGVTIYNTNKASDYAVQLQEELERIFIEQEINVEEAKIRSTKIAAGYGFSAADISGSTTKINDAQSYITLEEFIRRKYADGTLQDYAELITKLTDDTPIEQLDLDEINARIQVQKNFYFDKVFDEDTGLYYPRQIKNAEFVLIPKLLPEGSELRKVYDWMVKNDIGQLNTAETSKAAKKNILAIWDAETGVFDENFEDKYNGSYLEDYYYQYLYKQQDVPQHLVDQKNKAGVQIMKKIIDNIYNKLELNVEITQEDIDNNTDKYKRYIKRKQLIQLANEFLNAYSANIKEDFNLFLDSMGWEYNEETGKIVNAEYATTDSEGNPLPEEVIKDNRENLNFSSFWTRAREEAARTGMDSNFMEYLIPNEFGKPIMPTHMNSVSSKLESIAQSIYNSKITRQTLPGWHAAQITAVGYSKKLNFDVKTGTMEVYLPRWSDIIPKGKTKEEDEAILKQIQEEGLDIHLGYRIPTEGKQSIAILKVVGFTNDCLGSTIVVPDEWVTQTGSDFDVDSVYGISWEMYKKTDKKGNVSLHKVPFEESEVNNIDLYISHVNEHLDAKIKRTDLGEQIDDTVKEIKSRLNFTNERNELNEEFKTIDANRNELFDELPSWARGIIKDVNKTAVREEKKKKIVTDLRDVYTRINQLLSNFIDKYKIDNETREKVEQYIDYQTGFIDVMNCQEGLPAFDKEEYLSQKKEEIQKLVEEAKNKYFEKVKDAAKETGIMSFDEFVSQPFVNRLSRKARNNYILSRMITIMSDATSHEEQYGRSNFDKVVNGKDGANDIIDNLYGEKSRSRSPYNPLDQLDYFEDAMGGARLKALSVNWDTFVSKINKIRAYVSIPIDVVLKVEGESADGSAITFDEDKIRESYDKDIEDYNPTNYVLKKPVDYYDFSGNMNMTYGNNKRKDITSDSTIDAIINGERTATTRYKNMDYWSKVKKGDIIRFAGNNKTVYVRVTKPFAKLDNNTNAEEWSKKEGWSVSYFNKEVLPEIKKGNAYQVEYEYIGDKYIQYYNEDGTLKDNNFTRTVKKESVEQSEEQSELVKKDGNKRVVFKARRIGWSNNNHNLVGGLVTTDTSQTTAHHLDAVKMGSIPNVDEFTFSVYKLLSALGIDFETTIAFIRQPIITELIGNKNLTESVFFSNNGDPFKMTLAGIASDLKLKKGKHNINQNSYLKDIISALATNYQFNDAFIRLYGIDLSKMTPEDILNISVPLDKEKLFTRIKLHVNGEGDVFEKYAFDFAQLLLFNNIKRSIAEEVNKLITATSPDKYGANPSLREARNTINNINDLRSNLIITKDNKTLIDLIFPIKEDNNNVIDIDKSEYKSLASIYAYATIPSVQTNTKLFITENEHFAKAEKYVQRRIKHFFTDAEYKEYKKYYTAVLYNKVQKLLTPLTVDKRGNIIPYTLSVNEYERELLIANKYWNMERSRICGYGITTDGYFDIKDINNPIDEEIDKYLKLTPAQKVLYIQRAFPDFQGIFKYIKVTLLNNTDVKYRGISRQYLSYDDQVDNIEDLLYLFDESFFNRNPLIKLAAIDLIKYSFIAEGFNFKSGYINKIITNDSLYTSADEGGMDIINSLDNNNSISDMIHYMPEVIMSEEFIEIFVRSHSDIIKIARFPDLPPTTIDRTDGTERYSYNNISTSFKHIMRTDGVVHIDTTIDNNLLKGIINKLRIPNNKDGYVRVNFPIDKHKSKTVLFKIEPRNPIIVEGEIEGYRDYFLIPLNLLDKYETYDYSYNKNYNEFNSREYYDDVVNKLAKEANAVRQANEETEELQRKRIARVEANKAVPSVKLPIGEYVSEIISLEDNPNKLLELYDSAEPYTKAAIKRLLDGIVEHIENTDYTFTIPFVQLNQSYPLSQLIPAGTAVNQNIELSDGSIMTVTIAHRRTDEKNAKIVYDMSVGNIPQREFKQALKEMKEAKISPNKAQLYRITRAKLSEEELNDIALNASTDLITDENENIQSDSQLTPRRGRSNIDVVSSAMINEINYDSRKNDTAIANRFIKELDTLHVNRQMGSSLTEHRVDIYRAAARYYRAAANTIINKLNKFEITDIDGNVHKYSMDEPAMYEMLSKHDEYFAEVAKIILDGITFGNRISDIFKLDASAEDKETKDSIDIIIASINSVRQNKKLSDAMNNMINIYFKKYSTNPEVINDILELRETFGDLDVIDAWIANPSDIDNNEVQTILKKVYGMFAKAELFDAQRNVKEFKDRLAEIEALDGSIDISNVIDLENMKLRQAYNDEYIKARQEVIDKLQEAKNNKDNSDKDFANYIRAKYERDKFMYEHTEQHIVDEYYEEDLRLREEVMNKAGNIYIKYMKLTEELYKTIIGETEEQATERKKRIMSDIAQLRSEINVLGEEKSVIEASKARALNSYIESKKALRDKYFDFKEYDGFQEDYKRYKKYIDEYNKRNPYDTLDKKLQNAQYKEAYDWINRNGRVMFSKEQAAKLKEAFKIITRHTSFVSNTTMSKLRNIPGVIDEAGLIDGTKLTNEQIEQLRNEESSELSNLYDDNHSEMILIKDVPDNIPLIRRKRTNEPKEISDIYDEIKYKNNVEKRRIITEINKIISKAIDRYTGRINVAAIFNNDIISNEERNKLANLYEELRGLRVKTYKKRNNIVYEDKTNDSAYNEAMNFYRTNLMNTSQATQFLNIFTEMDEDGNIIANPYIYGYREPKERFIDYERTNAIKYINDNVDFVTTEYYDIARNRASEQGQFEEWFERNHVYNPYTHKYEPLRIWTKLEAKPGSELGQSIEYVPSFANTERYVKDEYANKEKYKKFSANYKKGDPRYDSNIRLNSKEEALRNYIEQILNKYATTYQGKRFVGQGYLPRERKAEINTRYIIRQFGALLGISYHSGADSDSFHEIVDYSHDREANMKMLTLIKGIGTKDYKALPLRSNFTTQEEYDKELAKVKEENKKIKEENEKIDRANLNRDWKGVLENFVHNATIFNSRQAAKPYLYLLLEDLSVNNAYMIKGMWNKRLVKDAKNSIKDDTRYRTIPQTRTRDLIHNLTRRLLFDQYHENSTPRAVANLLQNMTSAKYMVFNIYGGVANITTGKVNIAMEEYANEYFGFKEFASAEKQYLSSVTGMIASMYSDKATDLTTAFIKQFNIVEFDQILQFGAGSKNLDENLRRIRNWMYSFQSMGEHYMQNSVLLAMLKSNRLYTDNNGVRRIGDFKDFTWNIEQQAMREAIKDDKDLSIAYEVYIKSLKYDIENKLNIDTGRKDINRNFLYTLRDDNRVNINSKYKNISEAYIKKREELIKDAKKQFNKNPTVESLYEFEDGKAILKTEAVKNFNRAGKNPIGDLEELIGGFKKKVEAVNKKIHGVYDRDDAAQLESKWFGSLIMQYHKHLYTGIMKRWRRKGFYSEFRGSKERGSYQTLIDFIGTEFINFKKRVNNKQEDGTNIALASVQTAIESVLNTFVNIQFNWNILSEWERSNMRRNLGDMSGVIVACLIVMALYAGFDDDDIKDDTFKSSLLYLADRLYAETTMYTPPGLVTEAKTAWSSPVASANGPSDLIKACLLIPQALFDPDYNPNYQTGQYAGRNKFDILFRRNLPGIRPYDRIQFITKNNKYYKIGNTNLGIKIAKNFGETIND